MTAAHFANRNRFYGRGKGSEYGPERNGLRRARANYGTALHEAAHCLLCFKLAVPVSSSSIAPSAGGGGTTIYSRSEHSEENAMICLAGWEAESLAWPHIASLQLPDDSDHLTARAVAAELSHGDESRASALIEEWRKEAREVLSAHWQVVLSLAEDLLEHGTLDERDLRKFDQLHAGLLS